MSGNDFRTFEDRPAAVKSKRRVWLTAKLFGASEHRFDQCRFCGRQLNGAALPACVGCACDLPWIDVGCSSCGLPLGVAPKTLRQCGNCLQRRDSADGCFVPFVYAAPIDTLVKELKFAGGLAAGRELAALMLARGEPRQLPNVLIPVPLHWRRLAARGYNQAQLLAEYLSGFSRVPLLEACQRRRSTLAQSMLDARLRTRNVRGAFRTLHDVRGLSVAIVDDVITTGTTIRELVRVLRHAGARRVDVWAVARAINS